MEWFALEETFKNYLVQTPNYGPGHPALDWDS